MSNICDTNGHCVATNVEGVWRTEYHNVFDMVIVQLKARFDETKPSLKSNLSLCDVLKDGKVEQTEIFLSSYEWILRA